MANLQTAPQLVEKAGNIFRQTNRHKGRKVVITPENSSMQHLCYGRVLLDGATPESTFETGKRETSLICLRGECKITSGSQSFTLGQYDAIYIPKNSAVKIQTGSSADLAEFSAEVAGDYPLQVVRYAEIKQDNSLHLTIGGPSAVRNLNVLVGKNVKAGRLLVGFTISDPGNWTSWPPHEHAAMLEEMYVYTEMPAPAFGIQFVYTDTNEPELVTIVRDGDAVLMPRGYHPNVAAPGHRIGFLWAMAAHREEQDRQYGVVNVQPEFGQSGSGLEAAAKK